MLRTQSSAATLCCGTGNDRSCLPLSSCSNRVPAPWPIARAAARRATLREITRPPLSQELGLGSDGRLELTLESVWRDGTRTVVFRASRFVGTSNRCDCVPRIVGADQRSHRPERLPFERAHAARELGGVLAIGDTLEACRDQLAEVLEEWILVRVARGLDIPPLGGI